MVSIFCQLALTDKCHIHVVIFRKFATIELHAGSIKTSYGENEMEKETLVKQLKAAKASTPTDKEKQSKGVKVKVTLHTISEEDLPYLVRKRLFLIRPKVLSAKFHYLPCWRVVLKYSVSYFKKNRTDDGTIEFIVDPIRGCGANEEKLNLKLVKKAIEPELLVADTLTRAQAEKRAIVDARWKVLMAKYKRSPELETDHIEKFYRPYYELRVAFAGKTQTQFIAADDFSNYFVYN